MSVKLIDVARAAGVSTTTASDALRGEGRVSEHTRQTVLTAATRLGYRPNRSARSLRTATTGAVGLYLPQVLYRTEYYLAFLHGVATSAANSDYDVTLLFARGGQLDSYRPYVDGIVTCDPREGDPVLGRLLSTDLPVVSCEPIPGDDRTAGVVWSDGYRMSTEALDALRDLGSSYPALLNTTTPSQWPRDIERGYLDWCSAAAIRPVSVASPLGADTDDLTETVRVLLDREPRVDAIICVGDGVAARLAPSIAARGYRPGEDFLLAACSERPIEPPISVTIDSDGDRAARECVRLLLDVMDGTAEPGTRRELALRVHTAAGR